MQRTELGHADPAYSIQLVANKCGFHSNESKLAREYRQSVALIVDGDGLTASREIADESPVRLWSANARLPQPKIEDLQRTFRAQAQPVEGAHRRK